uniref:L-galactose dehydrogenase (L-GalDH) n=1 Tax=Arundo donax TaxID=35708 RepID=A0A0A9D9B9_ARUDO
MLRGNPVILMNRAFPLSLIFWSAGIVSFTNLARMSVRVTGSWVTHAAAGHGNSPNRWWAWRGGPCRGR